MADEPRKRRGRADYEALLAEHGQSGLTLRAFAETAGVNPATLYSWNRRLRPRQPEKRHPGKPRLVPLRVVDAEQQERATQRDLPAPCFELSFGAGRLLSIPPRFDAGELRRLLAVLDAQ